MKKKLESRSQAHQMFAFVVFIIYLNHQTNADSASQKHNSEILIKTYSPTNSTTGVVPKILKLTHSGSQESVHSSEIIGESLFTLKSDPIKVQSEFKTMDISVLNKQRDKENAKKFAIVQKDLQSRVKISESEITPKQQIEMPKPEADPEEALKKQAQVKEDIESRILLDYGLPEYGQETERKEKLHYPVKRSDDDYYADESEPPQQTRMSTEPSKEEDSFFSIFESLFGSSDDDSQTKKKSNPEDKEIFKDSEDASIKENIKTVGNILKPLRPIDQPESETQSSFIEHQSNVPEYRIVNNFHASQSHKQIHKHPESKPAYHNFYRPTEKPFRPYKLHSTNGYEDYDLEEFMDKGDTTTKTKYISPVITTISSARHPTTNTITTTTSTTARTTPKSPLDNKLKFPSIQKKNDYINRNRYQEVTEKITERIAHQKEEIKTTTEIFHYNKPNHENKDLEQKTQKIQESPNFYNLINLPVRYSTKDTAIPLISTSYANTKIQGMGAHKYEKGANGKYPNHKYDQISSSTTKRPNYWATKRTITEETTSSFRPSPMIQKITTKDIPTSEFGKMEYDEIATGMGPELGNYGSKTGMEVKTQMPFRQTSTNLQKEATTKRNDFKKTSDSSHQTSDSHTQINETKTLEKTSVTPNKEIYEEYEYDSFSNADQEAKLSSEKYPPILHSKKTEEGHKNQYYNNTYKTTRPTTLTPVTENQKLPEVVEYEYYDYDADPSTTTTPRTTTITTTTLKYKVKYPNLSKDKIKTSSSEKVAVVVPSKNHEFYNENQSLTSSTRLSTVISSSITSTTTTNVAPFTLSTKSAHATSSTENDILDHFKKSTTQFYKPSQVYKEPAPVFENVKEDYTTSKIITTTTTRKKIPEKPILTTEETLKPLILTSPSKDQETNANIVLVPAGKTTESAVSQHELFESKSVQKTQSKPTESYHSGYDYTTEFTIGVVQGGNGVAHGSIKGSLGQGHFVASSISTDPYGDDEPFRPIPKPPGMISNFHSTPEEAQKLEKLKSPSAFHNKRPLPNLPKLEETEPIHEPHEFIPSPQFHRPLEPKSPNSGRPGFNIDYDFEGIQTEPKPGQYVMFSKPQLNPEMNENQLKKNPEITSGTKIVSNVPHYHDKNNLYWPESQKHVVLNPSEGMIYQSVGKPQPSPDKSEQGRPVYGNSRNDDPLPLQLVPPRESQSEKPFEGNFILPEEKQESTVSYPRPHWEKNSKPSFLMNTFSNKNDIIGSRHPPLTPHMVPTLIPPSSIPPQRFRRPIQPHMPPLRKNFNEAGTNAKPKPNLPNILPQFRPNTKGGSGPYPRPPGYHGSNRRNGLNRYHEKEHGNFPYHIQHPDKDIMHREYEVESDIIPKFITNRGKLPSEMWNHQGMQKRFGQGPQNSQSEEAFFHHDQRILKRHQRTPVTTLQMLKQIPGVKTQKAQISREDSAVSSVPLQPPIYKTYVDQPKTKENVYIVYPAKAPQKLHSDDTKVFIVSDTKSNKNYNMTKGENQNLLLNPVKRENDKSESSFPYGFVKPFQRVVLKRKEQKGKDEDFEINIKGDEIKEEQTNHQKLKIAPVEKDEKIDMMLHMQSNNQWNEVRTHPNSVASFRNPSVVIRNDHYRFSDHISGATAGHSKVQFNPPSEYHTSIKDDSAFTLGAVMHTMSEGSRKGQVASIPLHDGESVSLPKLNVNERISNGKIVTVSMPLDVKQDSSNNESHYQFQAPFQPSSSLMSNESHPVNQGWSIVKSPDDESHSEEGKKTAETSTTTSFNFENFKPELIGGFKPIFEIPEEPEESTSEEKMTNGKTDSVRAR